MLCQVCKATLTPAEKWHPMCGNCWIEMEAALVKLKAITVSCLCTVPPVFDGRCTACEGKR